MRLGGHEVDEISSSPSGDYPVRATLSGEDEQDRARIFLSSYSGLDGSRLGGGHGADPRLGLGLSRPGRPDRGLPRHSESSFAGGRSWDYRDADGRIAGSLRPGSRSDRDAFLLFRTAGYALHVRESHNQSRGGPDRCATSSW